MPSHDKEKIREAGRRYRAAHKEEIREKKRQWRKARPDLVKEMRRRWKEKYPELVKERRKRYVQKHKEEMKAYRLRYYRDNIERRRTQNKEWSKVNRERSRDAVLRRVFGISLEKYNSLFTAQNGVCAICQTPPIGRKLAVDHCHMTGKIRGLLCTSCNIGLGYYEKVGEGFARYLRECTK